MENYTGQALITLSYDDGKLNNYRVALPLHEAYRVPASFAIIANRALRPKFWSHHMNPMQIVDASRRGVEITSHGMMHQSKFTDLDATDLDFELRESQQILNGFVYNSDAVETLCLPFSASDDAVRTAASEFYTFIRGHGGRLNDPLGPDSYVTSHGLRNYTSFEEVQEIIDQAVAARKWLVLMLHGVVNEDHADGRYDISRSLLEQILSYVNELGSNRIQPVTFKDVKELRSAHRRPTEVKFETARTSTATKSRAHTIADAPGYLITYHKNPTENNIVVISFGGLPSKKTAKGFASNFILKQGYDHIFVAQEAGSQYQKLALDEFTRIVFPYIEGKKVYTYGSSLGAYAALYYGGAIDARIIASAPKNSAHPLMRKRKFEHVDFSHRELKDVPKSQNEPIVLFDPHREEESAFIEHWVKPAYPQAHYLEHPFAGHTVLNTMQHSGVLKEFITNYLEKDEIIPFTLRQEDSYIWHAEKGRYMLQHSRYEDAQWHFEKSLSLKQNGEAAAGLVRVLLKTKQPEQAQEVVDHHYDLTGDYKGLSQGLRRSVQRRLEQLNHKS